MAKMTEQKCRYDKCGIVFAVRQAYVDRGQGHYCSKACQARALNANLGHYIRRKEHQPHIFFASGWWRVSLCKSRSNAILRLYHKAHLFAARLNEERHNGHHRTESST